MRILMLDKNYLVDRRIVLFAQSLAAMGHELKLINLRAPDGFADPSERRRRLAPPPRTLDVLSLPADKDVDFLINPDGIGDAPPHVREVRNRWFRDPRTRRRIAEQERAAAGTKLHGITLDRANYYLKYPDLGVEDILSHPRMGALRYLAAAPFAALALPTYLRKHNKYDPIGRQRIRGVRRLDAWERAVVRHAVEFWRPDVVVANDAITLLAGAEIKARLGIPLVFDEHELYSYQLGIPHDVAKTLFREEVQMLRHVDSVILPNWQGKKIMERDTGYENYIVCSNAASWPKGFDIKRRYDWIRDEVDIPRDHKIVLFQGGINTGRRVDYLLKGLAAAKRKDVHMVFLTFGQEIPEFKQMARDLGIAGRVHFLDLVPWDEVLFWAASADAGIMPYQASDQNTVASSPNKMYEFIMAGTPMIASSGLVNVRRVVESEGFGVLEPFNTVDDYARGFEQMFNERLGGAERFRPALIEKAHKYSWENESRDAIAYYQRLADEAPARRAAAETATQHRGR